MGFRCYFFFVRDFILLLDTRSVYTKIKIRIVTNGVGTIQCVYEAFVLVCVSAFYVECRCCAAYNKKGSNNNANDKNASVYGAGARGTYTMCVRHRQAHKVYLFIVIIWRTLSAVHRTQYTRTRKQLKAIINLRCIRTSTTVRNAWRLCIVHYVRSNIND